MRVTLVYAEPGDSISKDIECPEGISVAEFVKFVSERRLFPQQDLAKRKLAVWNRRVLGIDVLNDGDRVEVLRPLLQEPQALRRRRTSLQSNQ